MKKTIFLLATALLLSAPSFAKDLKTLIVKTTPEMHCNSCENKIKSNIRFVSGVKKIDTDLEHKVVKIIYDAEKTDSEKITAAFKKIGYTTVIVKDEKKQDDKKAPVDGTSGASKQVKPAKQGEQKK